MSKNTLQNLVYVLCMYFPICEDDPSPIKANLSWWLIDSLIKHHDMKTYWEVKIQNHRSQPLLLMLENVQFHTPVTLSLGTHWLGVWVGIRASLVAMEKGENLLPLQESGPGSFIVQPVAWSLY
jgi:hypothetical protein